MTDIAEAPAPTERLVEPTIPRKLRFLLEPHPYKVIYGGRFGMKTRSACTALLMRGVEAPLRILCARETMKSIEESLHEELKGVMDELELGGVYTPFEREIRGRNGTRIFYTGLARHTAQSIKGYANVDIVLIDEAQSVSKRSWDFLIPTIRKSGSEIWVLLNPDMADDDTYQRWIVHPLPDAVVVKTGWQDAQANGWFPEQENQKRLHFAQYQPKDYDNIWEGMPRTVVEGAIFADEVNQIEQDGRYTKVPYNPSLPVHTVWDLGWNDKMVVIMVQRSGPSTVSIINYLEVNRMRYDEVIGILEQLRYRWGEDWLPHDAEQSDPKSGTNARKLLQGMGRKVRIIPKSDPEARIRAARTLFPQLVMDNGKRTINWPDAYLGAERLLYCLRRYKRIIPKSTGEESSPLHDEFSHACDAFGGLSEIAGRLRSEFVTKVYPTLGGFQQFDRGLGTLG